MFLFDVENNLNRLLTLSKPSIQYVPDILSKLKKLHSKQIELEEKFNQIGNEIDKSSYQIFRKYLWNFCSDVYDWRSLARSLYRLEQLIQQLENYQLREIIEKDFKILFREFTLLIKDLITMQIKSETRQIDQSIEKLKMCMKSLKESVRTAQKRVYQCQTDVNILERILQAADNIDFDSKAFDQQDQVNINLLKLQDNLKEKSTKNDLIKFRMYIDQQVKRLIELNKQNAKELEQIKRMKTASCQAHQMQTFLSTDLPSNVKPHRMSSYQSSQPYRTFELEEIRRYQRQALTRSPYGTIPLYRRQAWAAANLFPNHSLHFLRYMQNSLRMQIHQLLGYSPSDIYCLNRLKQGDRRVKKEIFRQTQEISIVGTNNQLYRCRIDSCETMRVTNAKQAKTKVKMTEDEKAENMKINFDEFDPLRNTLPNEHLFQYLDWQSHFNEQDLSNELCRELFDHWQTVVCEEQPCQCRSEEEHQSDEIQSIGSSDHHHHHQCICRECACSCEKYFENEESIDEDTLPINDSIEEIALDQSNDEIIENVSIAKPVEEIAQSDCFINRDDEWTRQLDPFSSAHLACISNSFDLDDPIAFRQEIFNRHCRSPH
ncbi:unnamed protein product [Adineta ricciae]|uniref:Uncharacterized protein n=1 Tax=Adineta ricciae TaxID=249248 RepID=A0A814AQT3_ADIRI|nr:unnamed protein product [Adineta ricciae]CAF0917057.1 unnamed protein product [Adineta ricciae]